MSRERADDELERRLRALATEADPPPALVVDAAKAAFALRDLDAELAVLVADSAVDDPAVLTRAVVSDVRMLSFECGDVAVELDVETDPLSRRVRLSGLAVGAVGAVVAGPLGRAHLRRPRRRRTLRGRERRTRPAASRAHHPRRTPRHDVLDPRVAAVPE